MYDLSNTSLLSFEIGSNCNLKNEHHRCPINSRRYRKTEYQLTPEKIIECISLAKELGFNGLIAFHYYNEPLLYRDKLEEIIENSSNEKYLLWTNGMLLNRDVESNEILSKFSLVCISCYYDEYRPFFEALSKRYGNIRILDGVLDDRNSAYVREYTNRFGCKRPIFELPIDYHGNIHLCCYDWNNDEEIGNVFDNQLNDIVQSDKYQQLIQNAKSRLINIDNSPKICLNCDKPILYPKHFSVDNALTFKRS